MTFRKIVTAVDGGHSGRRALATALAVARPFAAHVEAVHVRIDPIDTIPFAGEGVSGALVQELIEQTTVETRARAMAARTLFDAQCAEAGVRHADLPDRERAGPTASWHETTGREEDTLVRLGRVADLIVVGRPEADEDPGSAVTLSVALFGTGHPVLVAAATVPSFTGAMAVAWNGSLEAARAVSAALPLLVRAARVRTLVACDDVGRGHADAAEVAGYLGWHGIHAEHIVISTRPSVAEALLAAAGEVDLLVMGGYSHSRLRELILGGVTRHMLEQARLPLLLAH